MVDEQSILVDGPAGQLELIVGLPATGAPVAVVIVCHPHPLYEGSMHNKVVTTLCRAALRMDCIAVRFNFRGVGASAGAFADGLGELDDARAVCGWVRRQWPGLPLGLAGFSFGAAIALRAAAVEHCFALITVAPPVGRLFQRGIATPTCPWLVIQGDADELVDSQQVRGWVGEIRPAPELTILDGVDHFFHGRLVELRDLVTGFLARQAPFFISDD